MEHFVIDKNKNNMVINAWAIPGIIRERKVVVSRETAKAQIIIQNICDYFNLPTSDTKKGKGSLEIVYCKQWCYWALVQETKLSLREIGQIMGGRHHTTTIHNNEVVKGCLASKASNDFKDDFDNIRKVMYNGVQKDRGKPVKRVFKRRLKAEVEEVPPPIVKNVRAKAQYSNTDFSKLHN